MVRGDSSRDAAREAPWTAMTLEFDREQNGGQAAVRFVAVRKVEAQRTKGLGAVAGLGLKRWCGLAQVVQRDRKEDPGQSVLDREPQCGGVGPESFGVDVGEETARTGRHVQHMAEKRMPRRTLRCSCRICFSPELPDTRIQPSAWG